MVRSFSTVREWKPSYIAPQTFALYLDEQYEEAKNPVCSYPKRLALDPEDRGLTINQGA